MKKKLLSILIAALLLLGSFYGVSVGQVPETPAVETTLPAHTAAPVQTTAPVQTEARIDVHGHYDSKEDVALFIHLYGRLPNNYMTKSAARELGWTGGSLEPYAPGHCIGGDTFDNREGLLPEAPGRRWTECDIDTLGKGSRGARRIVFSNDGLVYYTSDHYESFELLYGEP